MEQPDLKSFIASSRNDAITRATAVRRLDEIFTACDKIPLARLLSIILRKKEEIQNDPYNWSDKTFLKKLEQYQRELTDSYNPATGDFDLDDEK